MPDTFKTVTGLKSDQATGSSCEDELAVVVDGEGGSSPGLGSGSPAESISLRMGRAEPGLALHDVEQGVLVWSGTCWCGAGCAGGAFAGKDSC